MDDKFTSLVHKFLLAESVLDRLDISNAIFKLLETGIKDFSEIELILRKHFISGIKVCAINPNSQQRSVIVEIANFYRNNYTNNLAGIAQ